MSITLLVAAGLACVVAGKDADFDLLNYHYYCADALLHGRFRVDQDVAQLQTYHFALLDLPFYCFVQTLPPRLVAFAMGALQGLSAVVTYFVARRVLRSLLGAGRTTTAISLLATATGVYGPVAYETLGTTADDYYPATLILAALLVVLRAHQDGRGGPTWPLQCGVLFGLAVGGKLTVHLFLWPLLVTAVMARRPPEKRRHVAGLVLLGAALGFLATGGYWLADLYARFGNPVFPYYNDLFGSPWAGVHDSAFHRCRPKSLVDALLHPLRTAATNEMAIEEPFRDARYALVYLLLLVSVVRTAFRRRAPALTSSDAAPRLLAVFYVVGFTLWMAETAYLRYAPQLELLAPLLATTLLLRLLPRRLAVVAAVLSMASIAAWMRPPHRRGKVWTPDYFGVQVPEVPPGDVLGVLAGDEPSAYLVPFFPERVAFVRLESSYQAVLADNEMKRSLRERIAAHQGPLFLLSFARRHDADVRILARYGLRIDATATPARIDTAVGEPAQWQRLVHTHAH